MKVNINRIELSKFYLLEIYSIDPLITCLGIFIKTVLIGGWALAISDEAARSLIMFILVQHSVYFTKNML